MRDALEDWRRFDAGEIPSKVSTPHLDWLVAAVQAAAADEPLTLLDVGCGNGRLSRRLWQSGFSVLGVDVNREALRAARTPAEREHLPGGWLRFAEADFAAERCPRLHGGSFDVVVCQLVLSIIGDARRRRNLLRHLREHLRPGGWLYLSASGVSDTINDSYARLYAEDVGVTGERHTYLSRDERGTVLYMTHHFTADEIVSLLHAAGFVQIEVATDREASSRRPEEAAYFHYVACRAGPRSRS